MQFIVKPVMAIIVATLSLAIFSSLGISESSDFKDPKNFKPKLGDIASIMFYIFLCFNLVERLMMGH